MKLTYILMRCTLNKNLNTQVRVRRQKLSWETETGEGDWDQGMGWWGAQSEMHEMKVTDGLELRIRDRF